MAPTNGTKDTADDNELNELIAALAGDDFHENLAPKLKEDTTFAEEFGKISGTVSKLTIKDLPKASIASGGIEELDSSDDEEVKNFLERKYNEYGRDINSKLKQKAEEKKDIRITKEVDRISGGSSLTNNSINENRPSTSSFMNNNTNELRPVLSNSFKSKATKTVQSVLPLCKPPQPTTIFTDPIFGMRLINPLVSSSILTERMSGRTPVSMAGLAFHIERGNLENDWVVAGVILSKSPVKTTKKGASFSVWTISDLKGNIKQASLFLFKNAHKELWKTAIGMVIAVLNPSTFDKSESREDVAALTIDQPHKVMILGQSKDYGKCKAKKKSGDPCTAIVNLSSCDFCVYHVKQEFSRMSRRSELQSSTAGRGLHELRNKVLGKSEVFYGGQSFTAIPAKKSAKLMAKDQTRLMSLSEYYQSPNAGSVNHVSTPKQTKSVPYAIKTGPTTKQAGNIGATFMQRTKDLERLRQLNGEANELTISTTSSATTATTSTAATITTTSMHKESTTRNVPEKFSNREFSFSLKAPKLSQDSFSIDLESKKANFAKRKALEVLKKNPIEKVDPNFIKYRGTQMGKRRAIDDLFELDSKTKKQRLEQEQENERKTRIQKIIDATSSHTDLITHRENQEQDKYFYKLEKKEQMEEKMLSTYKVACKAVTCLKCKYTSFSAANRCKEEGHPLKVLDAEKRFFQCEDCGNRTITVHKMPKLSCKNCKGSRWKRSAMIREKKPYDPTALLSIRGDEEMFIGTVNSKVNVNLLIPET